MWRRMVLTNSGIGAVLLSAALACHVGADEKPASPGDPFTVPSGTPAEIYKFIEGMEARRPDGNLTFAERREQMGRQQWAIIKAADAILGAGAAAEYESRALEARYNALTMLTRLGDADADAEMVKFVERLKQSRRPDLATQARLYLIERRIALAQEVATHAQQRDVAQEEARKICREVEEVFRGSPPEPGTMYTAALAAELLNETGQPDRAREAYLRFAALMAGSMDPAVVEYGKQLDGLARRMKLLGSALHLEGVLFDGANLDWKQYRGKVVLVNFWATTWKPCLSELPVIQRSYQRYHERGFEVLGVCLDTERAPLAQFVADGRWPWPTLFSADPAHNGWKHPMAIYYGVTTLPAAILVDREGKVLTLAARGDELDRLLAEQFATSQNPAGERSRK